MFIFTFNSSPPSPTVVTGLSVQDISGYIMSFYAGNSGDNSSSNSSIDLSVLSGTLLELSGKLETISGFTSGLNLSNYVSNSQTGALLTQAILVSTINPISNNLGTISGSLSGFLHKNETGKFLVFDNLNSLTSNLSLVSGRVQEISGVVSSINLSLYVSKIETGNFLTNINLNPLLNNIDLISGKIDNLSGSSLPISLWNTGTNDIYYNLNDLSGKFNILSGVVTGIVLTGYVPKTDTGNFLTVSSLNNISNNISAVSGQVQSLSGMVTGLNLPLYVLKTDTGNLTTNNSLSIVSGHVQSLSGTMNTNLSGYVLTSQTGGHMLSVVWNTGSTAIINGLSGVSGQVQYLSGIISGYNLSIYALKSDTGTLLPASVWNTGSSVLSNGLISLSGKTDILSGAVSGLVASGGNLSLYVLASQTGSLMIASTWNTGSSSLISGLSGVSGKLQYLSGIVSGFDFSVYALKNDTGALLPASVWNTGSNSLNIGLINLSGNINILSGIITGLNVSGSDLSAYVLKTDTGNLLLSSVLITGNQLISGDKIFGGIVKFNDKLTFSSINDPAISGEDLNFYSKNIVGRKMFKVKSQFADYPLQPALFQNNYVLYCPNATTTITQFGHAAATVGTLSHPITLPDMVLGYQTNFASAITQNADAGISTTNAIYLRSNTGIYADGFFFYTRFGLPNTSGTYGSGSLSGHRLFVGLTNQTAANSCAADAPAGSYAGFIHRNSAVGSSGYYIAGCSNGTTSYLVNTSIPFSDSGVFDAFIFSPRFPNTGYIYWRLDNVINGTTSSGIFNNDLHPLPLNNTLMRGVLNLRSLSGVAKNIRMQRLYIETDR